MTIENNVTYTLWNVFGVGNVRPVVDDADVDALVALMGALEQEGLRVRGLYDVSGLRANADVMLWLHGQDPAALQRAARSFRRLRLLRGLTPVWNAMGVHRAAEFNRSHIPAFMRGATPAKWLTLYPFNRSYEWYLLPEEERREMLAEHGRAGGAYQTVLTNTVSAFALGDYEWLLPVEADDPVELVDMMRALRATKARRHVRDETPFFTGRRIKPIELVELVGS